MHTNPLLKSGGNEVFIILGSGMNYSIQSYERDLTLPESYLTNIRYDSHLMNF